MTARLDRAVANGNAAPSAKAVRRVSDDLCNDEAVRRVSDDRCNVAIFAAAGVPPRLIPSELAAKALRSFEDSCGRNCIRSACAGMICVFRSARRGVSEDAAATVSRGTAATMHSI